MPQDETLLKTYQILLLEDEPLVAMDLEASLEDLGFQNISVIDSVDGSFSAIKEKGRFDIALLDVNVVGGTSLPVADRLVEMGTVIIFTSGYVMEPHVLKKYSAVHMKKPFSESHITEIMNAAVSGLTSK